MDPSRCLFCTQAVAASQPRCPAFQLAGMAAYAACCAGCSTASLGIAGAPAEQPGVAR
jgi:hypothetical protein